VYLEARDQPTLGQKAVAEVALRRHESGRHGRDICAVVREPGQFALSYVPPGYAIDDRAAMNKALVVARQAIQEWSAPLPRRGLVVPGARYFAALGTLGAPPAWAQGDPVATIGNHAFFR
jgi:spore germination cell wall hydrolase CwlJ-like protein